MKERDASPFLLSSLLKATPLGPSLVRRCLASFALSGGAHGFPKVPDPAVALRRPVQDTVPTGAPATHASPSPSPSPTLLLLSKQRRSAGVDLWRPAFAAHGSTPPRILKNSRFFKVFGQDLPDGLQNPQVGAKMAHKPPKLEPRWPTDLPTWSQDGPKTPTWSQDAPKTLNFKDFGANLEPPDPQKTLKKQ